jgi:uroporphyrinogen III methyltransferase/synthase
VVADKGIVYLVGAGPGDPALLTLKGLWCLQEADVVVYDHLVSEYLLSLCRQEAELIYVGKVTDRHTLPQYKINSLLAKLALSGKRVCRLKGGDPFIFGRGGEEAAVLAAQGVRFEIVPGITAAMAVPAYAGIPVTHRDYAASVMIATGHKRKDRPEEAAEFNYAQAGAGENSTAVYLMGFENMEAIVHDLLEAGWSGETPAAMLRWGTRADQQTVTGTLCNIRQLVREAGLISPAILVVGKVVTLREQLRWREQSPLFGKRVLITRPLRQAHEFAKKIILLGGEPVCLPTIEIAPPEDPAPLDQALQSIGDYDWVVFTSVNGVAGLLERMRQQGLDIRQLRGKLAAIGPATAAALRSYGLQLEYQPTQYRAEALLEGLLEAIPAGSRVLMPRAAQARQVLPDGLRDGGITVEVVPAYQTRACGERFRKIVTDLLAQGRSLDYITFTSSSAARNFAKLFAGSDLQALMENCRVACIGPVTAETTRNSGMRVDLVAAEYTTGGLLELLLWDNGGCKCPS